MADDTSSDPHLDEAFRQVGRFMYHFARLEEGIDGIIGKALKLDVMQARIIATTIPLAQKVKTAQSVINAQLETNKEWKDTAIAALGDVNSINDGRKMVAHAGFSPIDDKSVQFRYATVGKALD